MTWEQFFKKWGKDVDVSELEPKKQDDYINDMFCAYEGEGFAKKFWSQGGDFEEYHGMPFDVIRRCTFAEYDTLPMWTIRFNNGDELNVYPDEVISREMRENGCTMDGI